jgi:hypothetical protein
MVDIVGIDAVKQVIKSAKFHQFVIHETRPTFKDYVCNSPNIWDATNADNQEDAANKFQQWAETVLNSNPNNHKTYYLHLGIFRAEGTAGQPPKYNPTICAFVLQGHMHPVQHNNYIQSAMSSPAGGRAASESEPNAPAQLSNHTNEMDHYKLMLELERARWENDQLRASILEEDDDDDDDEEEADIIEQFFGSDEATGTNPIKEALGKIVLNFAEQMTAAKPEQEVIKAFDKIKAAAPDAGKLMIKLGEIAEQNPAQIQEFINQILTTLNSSNNGTEQNN